ncbi:restriction endonuclease fold toxin-2 domain-containing protein [Streptomyces lydicus]|uniref:restriction endonuclease fold toxin-2 domain-containing protein n=1 Tax=Streptomyces lydicus TaxID=47763 RepID=UPI0037A0BE6D
MLVELVLALIRELDEQAGMAGDDDAGRTFNALYHSAAKTVVNQVGEAAHIMGRGCESLLETANNYMATESAVAAKMLAAIDQRSAAEPYSGKSANCTPAPRGRGEELPEAIGETTAITKYLVGDRFRGDPDKLRSVASSWRKAKNIAERILSDAQTCWTTASRNHEGKTAEAVNAFFVKFVGRDHPPAKADASCTLLANLPAACQQIANACDRYADHIETASKKSWGETFSDALFDNGGESVWDNPAFGGNGEDGGLHTAVTGDDRIMELASLGHSLDSSQERVPVPQPTPDPWKPSPILPPGLPLPLPPRIPILIPAGYTKPDPSLYRPAIPPPVPPDPRFPPLTPTQRQSFNRWTSGLRDGGFSGGTKAEKDYQLRTAGYPEKEVPIDVRKSALGTLMVDGLRDTDGMAVEAKFVKRPGCTYRNLDDLQNGDNFQEKVLHKKDEKELYKYKAAIDYPGNGGRMRGVEVVTNDPDAVPYWNALLVAHGVNGYGRHVP